MIADFRLKKRVSDAMLKGFGHRNAARLNKTDRFRFCLFKNMVSGKRLIVRQGKGQRDRLVYLSDVTAQAIQTYLQGSARRPADPLWLYPNGKPMTDTWLKDHLATIGKTLEIDPLYPHRLRHTCATRLLNAGMDITGIQKLLGHEMISTTMIYAKVQDATVEADYRQALSRIERQQTPLSDRPIAVADWPTQDVKVQVTIDNSV